MPEHSGEARMDLDADAWHQNEQGNYYIDCPECGSAATISNIVAHGRCNGYLDERESETELDEEAMSCTAKLELELVYSSDPDTGATDEAVGEDSSAEDARDDGSTGGDDAAGDSDGGDGDRGADDEGVGRVDEEDLGAGKGSDVDGTVE